ncbi:phosphate ABC transporter permease subunit PstC [Rhodobacteraceae bacterium NNCM2]|nr:phosphate ABC transporter permease subunit PstC [Coraliihabitans acroporae]
MLSLSLLAILLLSLVAFVAGRARAVSAASGNGAKLHSRPSYHGMYCLLWVLIVGVGLFIVLNGIMSSIVDSRMQSAIEAAAPQMPQIERDLVISDAMKLSHGDIASKDDELRRQMLAEYDSVNGLRNWVVSIGAFAAALAAFFFTLKQINVDFRARNLSERILSGILWVSATIAILTTVGIVLSLMGETLHFFVDQINGQWQAFFFGTTWSPLSGVHTGQMDPDKVGSIPLFAGTLMITVIAMLVAVPIGLFAAVYLSDFASPSVRSWAKPLLEILAGVPTVVYGFFAAITVAPFIRDVGQAIGLDVSAQSALAAGIVMGIMIIPFISSLSDDVINAVPQSLRDGSYGLGATKAETMRNVILPAALPGIVSAVLLGISRAVGETMIVVMAAGQGANLTWNPLEEVTTVTVQIVMLILGDTDASTAAGPAYTLGFVLFFVTLILNIVALRIVRKYREMYD